MLITGASSGIGAACAARMAELGFHVFAGVRNVADGESLKSATADDKITPVLIDVTDSDSISSARNTITAHVGKSGLSGLVNNAGVVVSGPLELLTRDEMQRQLDVNVLGPLAVTQAVLPLLRKARGRIVNMSSISGLLAMPLLGPYAASKFALEAISDSLRMELRSCDVKVVLIEPGVVSTPIWKKHDARATSMFADLPNELPAALTASYKRMLAGLQNSASLNSVPSQRVANVVARALTARRPRSRYVVGWDARLMNLLLRPLPTFVRDRAIIMALRRLGKQKI